jgi:hypothetical protein
MPKSKVQSPKSKVHGASPGDKPTVAQLAYESDSVRCFYCRALLIITDDKARYGVCSANCPSRLVQLDIHQVRLVRRAWHWQSILDQREKFFNSNSDSKECNDVSVESTQG